MAETLGDVQGKWRTAAVPELPAQYSTAITSVSTVFDYVIGVLQVANGILEVSRAFSTTNIDPLAKLAEEVIEQVESYLASLQQIGLYLHGDWEILQGKDAASKLQGGFAAYERRMLTRLVDTTDPDRPDIPNTQQVLAAFFYAGIPYSDGARLYELVRYVDQVTTWFGVKPKAQPKVLPTPVALEVAYGDDTAEEGEFGPAWDEWGVQTAVPTKVEISWGLDHGSAGPFVVAPDGYFIEISTLPHGLDIEYDRPKAFSTTVKPKRGDKTKPVQPRERGRVMDPYGNPLTLFGGWDQVDAPTYNNSFDSKGRIKDGYIRVYGVDRASKTLYPLDQLKPNDTTWLVQRTVYVPAGDIQQAAGGRYRAEVKYTDLPYPASQTTDATTRKVTLSGLKRETTYYYRVVPVMNPVTSPTELKYVLTDNLKVSDKAMFNTLQGKADGKGYRGAPSEVGSFEVLAANEKDFLEVLTTALAVMVLSRSDLTTVPVKLADGRTEIPGTIHPNWQLGHVKNYTGLEEAAKAIVPDLLGMTGNEYFDRPGFTPESFRADLLKKCANYAVTLLHTTKFTQKRRQELLSSAKVLQTWKWSDSADAGGGNYNTKHGVTFFPEQTIIESLRSGLSGSGIAHSAVSISKLDSWVLGLRGYSRVWGPRGPSFYAKLNAAGQERAGSSDMSPVLYGSYSTTGVLDHGTAKVLFCRNVIPAEVYAAAAAVLQQAVPSYGASASDDGGWIALRAAGWAPDLSEELDHIVEAMYHGLELAQAKGQALDRAIWALESKINQLTASLAAVRELMNQTATLQFDLGSVLLVVGDGTSGVIGGLTTAKNKPSDGPYDFGAGVVVVSATGAPVSTLSQFFLSSSG